MEMSILCTFISLRYIISSKILEVLKLKGSLVYGIRIDF